MTHEDPADTDLHQHHAIDYIELTVADMAAAARFYTAAFGWRFNEYGPGYSGIQGRGEEVGGLRLDATVKKTATTAEGGAPLVLLFSRDLDSTLAAVRRAGGRIVREPYTFPGGRRFHFADPSGNELGVWARE